MRITIEKLVYGGAGLARTSDGVIFVPRTAPGDVLEVELEERRPDYATGRIVSILEPSPDRQEPYCPNYETAGCCHWQHIRYERQLEIKEGILRETLQRSGRITWDKPVAIISGEDRSYRLRATFHVNQHRLGFMEEASHAVVPILECASLAPELNAFIPHANEILAGMAGTQEVREVRAVSATAVRAMFGKKTVGEEPVRVSANGFTFDLHPGVFFQSNRYLLGAFMNAVVEREPAQRVLDLFCGAGFFSIPLARAASEVLGVERNKLAVKQAELNTRLNGAKNVRFYSGEVAATIRRSSDLRPDLVVLNPPRSGCGRALAAGIADMGSPRVAYVSCNPSTFASEAPSFLSRGYTLEEVILVDQFPNTYHIEMVAIFRK